MNAYRAHGLKVDLEAVIGASKCGGPERVRLARCRAKIEQILAAIRRGDAKAMSEGEFRKPSEMAAKLRVTRSGSDATALLTALVGLANAGRSNT